MTEIEEILLKSVPAVRGRINEAARRAGRTAGEVRLMAVTKTHGPEVVEAAARHGLTLLGENRVQEATAKQALTRAAVTWELIGPLQSNKARLAAAHFDRIQTVDRLKIARALARAAEEIERPELPVLVQVNVGEDPRKSGLRVADAPAFFDALLGDPALRVLRVEGLMTIPPLDDDHGVARRCFAGLRALRDDLRARTGLALNELSMGMTADMEIAIEEGSTLVRVGTALFGSRGTQAQNP